MAQTQPVHGNECQRTGAEMIGLYDNILLGCNQRRQILILQMLWESHLHFVLNLKDSNPYEAQNWRSVILEFYGFSDKLILNSNSNGFEVYVLSLEW